MRLFAETFVPASRGLTIDVSPLPHPSRNSRWHSPRHLLFCLVVADLRRVRLAPRHAAGYPNKPITLVVPFAPGGFVHTVALMYQREHRRRLLGQSVVVLNKPGANGNIAAEFVAKSAPDGYTLFLPTASILTINPHLYKNLPFDALKDFAPVGLIANTSNMFVVSPRSGIKTFKDLVDKARANPGTVSYGSSGTGSIQHIAGESLAQQANVKLIHVPYKGVGAGADRRDRRSSDRHVQRRLRDPAREGRQARRHRGVAEADRRAPGRSHRRRGRGRRPAFPATRRPRSGTASSRPSGTPKDIVAKVNAAMAQTLKKPDVREKLLAAGATPAEDPSSEALRGVIQSDHARYGALLKTLNITVD